MGGIDRMGSATRRIARLAAYLAWTAALMPVQAVGIALGRRWTATFPCFYHRRCCRILGLRVRQVGQPIAERPTLFVANHISYLDITVLGSLIPGSFIAKAEVARWPFFGWLARLQRSVFVDRLVRSTAAQRDALAERLAGPEALILFPEGTSGDGNRLLPFKSALFAAAEGRGRTDPVTVQPVSIAYTSLDDMPIGRRYRPLLAWYGDMRLASHLWTMVGLGAIDVVVEFHPPTSFAACGSRKVLAGYCHGRIAGAVAAALSGHAQPMPEPPGRELPAAAPAALAEPVVG